MTHHYVNLRYLYLEVYSNEKCFRFICWLVPLGVLSTHRMKNPRSRSRPLLQTTPPPKGPVLSCLRFNPPRGINASTQVNCASNISISSSILNFAIIVFQVRPNALEPLGPGILEDGGILWRKPEDIFFV